MSSISALTHALAFQFRRTFCLSMETEHIVIKNPSRFQDSEFIIFTGENVSIAVLRSPQKAPATLQKHVTARKCGSASLGDG